MITCSFGRTIDDRCALFENVLVGEGFEDNFVADTVDVALCYTDFEFSFHDKKYVFFVIFDICMVGLFVFLMAVFFGIPCLQVA